MSSAPATRRSDRTPPSGPRTALRVWRWIVVLLVVAVLHWIAAQWVERNRATLNPSDNEHVPVQVALLTFGSWLQSFPHAPQLLASLRSTSQPLPGCLSQSARPA